MKKLLIISFLIGLCSCGSASYYTALDPEGVVLETTPTSVLVCFPVSGDVDGLSQGCATYSLKGGHSYEPGDKYPDHRKYNHYQTATKTTTK